MDFSAKHYLDVISGEHVSVIGKNIADKKANVTIFLTPYGYLKVRVKNNLSNNASVYVSVNSIKPDNNSGFIKAFKDSTFS